MYWMSPTQQLYAPWVAAWWLTGVAGLYWWAILGTYPGTEPRAPQLRLVAVNGKLIRS